MSDTDFQVAHSLNAVVGWLELGNTREARVELEALPKNFEKNAEILDLRWLLHAREGDWAGALKVAQRFVELHPEDPSGWLHRAYALRRVAEGGVRKALDVLRPAFEGFPSEPVIPFNLACYECQLDNLPEARRWLEEAFKRGDKKRLTAMALADDDLEKLWPELRKM